MRRFLTALIFLSILVMAQSVVAVSPAPVAVGVEIDVVDSAAPDAAPMAEAAALGGGAQPIPIFLLLTGISGLAAAGNRPARPKDSLNA